MNETGSEVVQEQLLALPDKMPRYVMREHEPDAQATPELCKNERIGPGSGAGA